MNSTLFIFSKNLRYYMRKNGMSQTDIARITGNSQQSVSNWVTAKQMPHMEVIETLSEHFHIMCSDLLEDGPNTAKPSSSHPKWDEETLHIMEAIKANPKPKTLFSCTARTRKDSTLAIAKLIQHLTNQEKNG